MTLARFLVGDVFDRMADIPDGSIDVVVTSPPFLALRSYLPDDHPDKGKEIGAEPTPAAFLDTLVDLTAEWRRVLAPHGSICVELGDTYSGSGGGGGDYLPGGMRENQPGFGGSAAKAREGNAAHWRQKVAQKAAWPLPKSLTGIPSLYAWSIAYGRNLLNPVHECEPWRVRNLIAWTRPNPPVGELADKCRPATSYITTACVGTSRYFDMDAERQMTERHAELLASGAVKHGAMGHEPARNHNHGRDEYVNSGNPRGAPLLDHWSIPTQPYAGSHYAAFPMELPRRCLSLMCPPRVCTTCGTPSERIVEPTEWDHQEHPLEREGIQRGGMGTHGDRVATPTTLGWTDCGHDTWRPGRVLDPFAGSGTTLAVAVGMGREAIGIDLDERNAHLAEQRVGMFLTVEA